MVITVITGKKNAQFKFPNVPPPTTDRERNGKTSRSYFSIAGVKKKKKKMYIEKPCVGVNPILDRSCSSEAKTPVEKHIHRNGLL